MRYVISDIHGCYEEYRELLEKIHLTDNDMLYILGDTLDKGPEPIKVLQDLMWRKDVTYIIGNHDYLFLYFIRKLKNDLSEVHNFSEEDITDFKAYLGDGGAITLEQYMQLSEDERKAVCEYLENANVYDVIKDGRKKYILAHAGITGFCETKPLEEYDFLDFICDRMDYGRRYFKNESVHIITGHTPTALINPNGSCSVYVKNGHIAIDCGCVYGGRLAGYCIETGDVIYVDVKEKYCG